MKCQDYDTETNKGYNLPKKHITGGSWNAFYKQITTMIDEGDDVPQSLCD